MRVVVTGASGFLGRALTRRLRDEGLEVVGLTRKDIPGLQKVRSYADIPSGDVIVHLAEASNRHWVNREGGPYEQKALELLRQLLSKNFHHVIYASSAVLYGDQCDIPHKVDDPIHVVDTYTRIKSLSEKLVLQGGGVVARLANVYGPGMSDCNVLSAVLGQLRCKGPVSLFSTSPVRDFLWIDDAVDLLAKMVVNSGSGVFNAGAGSGTSIYKLAEIVLKAAGQSDRPIMSKFQSSDRSCLIVNIEKTEKMFFWHPSKELTEGVSELVRLTLGRGLE